MNRKILKPRDGQGLVQAAFGNPVPLVSGPPPVPFPLYYPDLGLYAAPTGEVGGLKDAQQA